MINNKKIGLALSGGGYRAAAYHLGTLKKLNELGILKNVDVISAVSGGSIIAASYGLHKGDFKSFEEKMKKVLKTSIIRGIITSKRFLIFFVSSLLFFFFFVYLLFTKMAWISSALLLLMLYIVVKYQFKILPISDINENLYNKLFYKGASLKDLSLHPIIAINTTNLATGRPFTFSYCKMSDSTYEYPSGNQPKIEFIPGNFPVARAVAASTCVPFAFTPVSIEKQYFKNPSYFEDYKPLLVDGGVYDNQGLHKLTEDKSSYGCDIIIVSDAGNNLPKVSTYQNTIGLLIRTSDLFMNRIKNFQMRQNIFNTTKSKNREIAYQSLGWDHNSCLKGCIDGIINGHVQQTIIDAHGITIEEINAKDNNAIEKKIQINLQYDNLTRLMPSENETELARNVSTNLKALSELEIIALSKHAEMLTELQVKLYCPSLLRE